MSDWFRFVPRAAAALFLVAGFALPAAAQTTIKVVVNGEPITTYDISQRDKLLRVFQQPAGTQRATDALINEVVQLQEARRRGIRVTDAQVNAAYDQLARGAKLTPAQLTQYLQQQGVAADTLKSMRRAQIAWQFLVESQMRRTNSVKQSEVAALLAKTNPDQNVIKEYLLQRIVFTVPKGSSSGFVAQRRREAQNFSHRFPGCDRSLEQAKTLRGVVVKPPVRRDTAAMVGAQGEALKRLAVGKTTPPEQTDDGIEIVAVCSVRDIQSSAGARAEIENKLAQEQFAELAPEFLKELRDKAIIINR